MMVEWRDFKASDILLISTKETVSKEEALRSASAFEQYRPNNTLVLDGKVAACGGVRVLWRGVGEAWVAISEDAPFGIAPLLKGRLYKWIKDYGLRRLQSVVRCDWKEGNKFLKFLGMRYEGRMAKMLGADTDANLWAVTV